MREKCFARLRGIGVAMNLCLGPDNRGTEGVEGEGYGEGLSSVRLPSPLEAVQQKRLVTPQPTGGSRERRKTSWKVVPQTWACSRVTSVVGSPKLL